MKNKNLNITTNSHSQENTDARMLAYQKRFDTLLGKKKTTWRQVRKG